MKAACDRFGFSWAWESRESCSRSQTLARFQGYQGPVGATIANARVRFATNGRRAPNDDALLYFFFFLRY